MGKVTKSTIDLYDRAGRVDLVRVMAAGDELRSAAGACYEVIEAWRGRKPGRWIYRAVRLPDDTFAADDPDVLHFTRG